MNEETILIVEDEIEIRRFLSTLLSSHGYKTKYVENGKDAIKEITVYPPNIVILDLNLPDLDGIEIIKNIRQWSNVPIIILSARDQENDKVNTLEAGADDYLTKPFGAAELLVRIKVALRHQQKSSTTNIPIFIKDDLKVDLEKRQIFIGNNEIHLTQIEYKILAILVRFAGKIVTYRQLLKEVWGKNYVESNHYLRIHMQHLRQKLNDDPLQPKYIMTETGIGYRLQVS